MKGLGMVADAAAWRKIVSPSWDESQHPRQPAGCSEGGEFCSAGGTGNSTGRVHGLFNGGIEGDPWLNQTPRAEKTLAATDVDSYVADTVGGEHVGDGECVSLVKDATDFKGSAQQDWVAGPKLTDLTDLDKLRPGTAIAIFGSDGKYHNTHAAIFLGYSESPRGIWVLDQWNRSDGKPQKRFYPFDGHRGRTSNASNYAIVTTK